MRIGALGRGTIVLAGGLGMRAIVQALYLVLLSRALGPADYGLFAASVVLATLFAPLSGWGIGYVLTERVAKGQNALPLWRSALAQTIATGFALALGVAAGAEIFLSARLALWPMLLIAIAELVLLPVAQVAAMLLTARSLTTQAALSMCIAPIGRLIATGAVVLAGASDPAVVAVSHCAGTFAGTTLVMLIVYYAIGPSSSREREYASGTLAHGTKYALSAAASTAYADIDKVIMLQMLGAATTGLYTAPFRILSVATLPVMALMNAALPRLFGVEEAAARMRTLTAVTAASIGYGLVAAAIAMLLAPLTPWLLGQAYVDSIPYLRGLALWLPLYAIHQSGSAALTTSGRQAMRTGIDWIGVGAIIALNAMLLPRLGAAGAVVALLLTEILMAIACWFVFFVGRRRVT
jgi:O-antigen/teichoic acid export membrane protein